MAAKTREVFRIGFCVRYATEGTRLESDLVLARVADLSAATDAKHAARRIDVPLLETDRAPRSKPRRERLPLRVRLAPRPRGLVFRCDARADLVGVRPRRGAVEDGLRGRRRGRRRLRPGRFRRALVSDLLARLAVAAVAPVDALTVRRAVPAGSRRGALARRPRADERTVLFRRDSSARSLVWPHKSCT